MLVALHRPTVALLFIPINEIAYSIYYLIMFATLHAARSPFDWICTCIHVCVDVCACV